jgi:NAD(P)-dependent dehydrogenase (short-subunit alcohol dehydrogenase family)
MSTGEAMSGPRQATRPTILEQFRLDGQSAFVTGGGQGIGRAYCHALGEAGAKLAVADIDLSKAEQVVTELRAKDIEAFAVAVDASDRASIDEAIGRIMDRLGSLDIAVNNAGVNFNSPAEETSAEQWDATFSLNLRGVFLCCQAEARIMLPARHGKIINTASMSSIIVPHPQKQAAYNTSKAGVVALTRSLATEWAHANIQVNCISPGIVRTPLIESDALAPLAKEWIAQIPAGRFAEVSDLQGAIVFLASRVSDYMVGHNLVIDGGHTVW